MCSTRCVDLVCLIACVCTECPKKCTSDFFSHHWHKYFTHMENKDRYGILIVSAFHAIFCFYSTPFQFFAIIRQSMSQPIFIHFIGPLLDDRLKENLKNPETLKGCPLYSLSCLSVCLSPSYRAHLLA